MPRRMVRCAGVCVAFVACGGKTLHSADDAGQSVDVPPPLVGARPPPRPSVTATGPSLWFAFDRFDLGGDSGTSWMDLGYDLDGRETTAFDSATSTGTCRRRAGAKLDVLADGHEGRDNNYVRFVIGTPSKSVASAGSIVNDLIRSGKTTLLLRLDNVNGDDNAHVPGELFLAASLRSKPSFVPSEKWPIDDRSVDDTKHAKVSFPNGYMARGFWVSGDLGADTKTIFLPFGSTPMTLPLESAVLSVRVADGSGGVIAGGIATSALLSAIAPTLGPYGVCPGDAIYDQLSETIQLAADLVSGAQNLQDTSVECNALSIGFGFSMKPTAVPDPAVTVSADPTPCK